MSKADLHLHTCIREKYLKLCIYIAFLSVEFSNSII
jgi:hypothetical protein